jgi:hypothetical protein
MAQAQFSIPKVVGETDESKNAKMTIVFVMLLIAILLCIHYQNQPDNTHNHHLTHAAHLNTVSVDLHNTETNSPIKGKYIILTNMSKKNIPVQKVVVMAANRQLYKIDVEQSNHCKFNKAGKYGSIMEFELPKEMLISQIMIDVNQFCGSRDNIRTTQVEIRDADRKIVWTHDRLLAVGERYVTVYVVKHDIKLDNKPQQVLCTGSPNDGCHGPGSSAYRYQDQNQELQLMNNVVTNIWQ